MTKRLLVRHGESRKNAFEQFGSANDDGLTAKGRRQAAQVKGLIESHFSGRASFRVVAAPEPRCVQTSEVVRGSGVEIESLLAGRDPGLLGGLTQAGLKRRFPEIGSKLQEYRSGLRNGYDVEFPQGEDAASFEARILEATERHWKTETPLAVIATRSVITTIAINMARRLNGYPTDFFGFIELDLCSIVEITEAGLSVTSAVSTGEPRS